MEHQAEIYEYLTRGLAGLGLDLPEKVLRSLTTYFTLVRSRTKVVNLISSKQDLPTQVMVHLVDSLTPLLRPNWPAQARVLDIGSGGGFPAVPLALAKPDCSFVLAESKGKKARFLEEVCQALGLDRVAVRQEYLESRPQTTDEFDVITVRAVSALENLLPLARPRLNKSGMLILFKGPQVEQELKRAETYLCQHGMELSDRLDLELPLLNSRRSLLYITKIFESG